MGRWRLNGALAFCALVIGLLAASAGPAGAAPKASCSGDFSNFPSSVGTLSGTYAGNVTISGACAVWAGPAVINGNLTLLPGSTLVAAFAAGNLTVNGSLLVKPGAALIMGCNPDSFPCIDDATATSLESVSGNLVATHPLGLVMHNTTIQGNAHENGGGGGVSCDSTPGVFGLFGSPAYIDNEDSTINGNLIINGARTCWLGSLRDHVGGNLVDTNNRMADPDAGEVVNNWVQGNLICTNNSPQVQFGDSGAAPNQVSGNAGGECGFNVFQPDPNYPNFDGTGGPQPISIKAG
jgi:hypothetical protein